MLEMLSDRKSWEKFYQYKQSLFCPKKELEELKKFIENEEYLPVCESIYKREKFSLANKMIINKQSSQKSRVVYSYPYKENMVLKLLTYLMLRKYNSIFCKNLYSFRPGKSASHAIRMLRVREGIDKKYAYKVDVSNYFNSIPVSRLLPILRETLVEDLPLYDFLKDLLEEEFVIDKGKVIREQKGIMAGTPIACFYANLYLSDMDKEFFRQNILYARYSDDIILFGDSQKEVELYAKKVRGCLLEKGLEINPQKEIFTSPKDGFTFLGFSYKKGVTDIAPVTVEKLKKKMRRKTRALKRWSDRKHLAGEKAAAAFIRIFNAKLLENPRNGELSWKHWFFSMITTSESLHEIDKYAQDCLRFLISKKRSKGRYQVRYEDLKSLGYQSLVHAYYEGCKVGEEVSTKLTKE
ncbi:MAG TPA: reverse transcriptase/maturase family protein [Lachnospiraceae bacterium]